MKIGEPDEVHCIYVGMHRPKASPQERFSGRFCPCGMLVPTKMEIHDHWRRGHFDVPVYASLREMNEARGMMYADQSVWRPLMPFYAPKSDPKPGEIGAPCAVHHGAEVKTIGGPPAERMYPCCHGTGILKVDQNACQHYFAPNRPHCCDKCGKTRYGVSESSPNPPTCKVCHAALYDDAAKTGYCSLHEPKCMHTRLQVYQQVNEHWVACIDCGAEGPRTASWPAATEAWHRQNGKSPTEPKKE